MSLNGSCDIAALVFRSPLLPTAIIATSEIYLCQGMNTKHGMRDDGLALWQLRTIIQKILY